MGPRASYQSFGTTSTFELWRKVRHYRRSRRRPPYACADVREPNSIPGNPHLVRPFSFAKPLLPLHPTFLSFSSHREKHSASRTQGDVPTHTLFFACRCEEGCRGRFLISAGDDTTHPYGVRGQRIGVGLYHP